MTDVDYGRQFRLERADRRWRALFAGHLIADSPEASILHRGDLPPMVFFPRRDVSMEYMSATDHRPSSPRLGEATSYTLLMDGNWAENAVWSFAHPDDEFAGVCDCIAFDPSKIDVYSVDEAVVHGDRRDHDRSEIDEIVQHTDSGGGVSQREHWAPNVPPPEA